VKSDFAINSSGIRDNHRYGRVADFLIEKLSAGSKLSVVSAYFTIYAYERLKQQLEEIDSLKFLFGEPRFITSLDPQKDDRKIFRIEDEHLELSCRLQQKEVARRCAEWISKKVEIRSIRQANLLHGKLYHLHDGHRDHAILGSSNFTRRGLGLSATPNIELNLIVDSDRDRAALKAWFDDIWKDDEQVIDIKKDVLEYLEQLYKNHSPEFIYFKTLYHVFEQFLSDQADDARLFDRTEIIDTQIWKTLYDFQKDGAKGAIHKINTHNGCILADSVGLGKTYTALAVIKYYELRNHRVLVLCPKKLRDNWTVYLAQNNSRLNPFLQDRFAYTVLSHTDLSRDSGRVDSIDLNTLGWGNYDLIVIDESHNFRNNIKGKKDIDGNLIRKSRYERLMQDIIQAGVKTKVLLLSATPVNNNLKDLRNQIYFITEDKDNEFADSLGIVSLKDMLSVAQRKFTNWARREHKKDARGLIDELPAGFFTLLDGLTIARSRKHLQRHYRSSMKQIGEFPKRKPPQSLSPKIDLKEKFPSYDQLHEKISDYQLSLFNPSRYILEEFKEQYENSGVPNFTQSNREHFLIGMMKVNFLKRLESSVHSFDTTMKRTIGKIDELEERIRTFNERQSGQAEEVQQENFLDSNEEDEDVVRAFEVGGKLRIRMAHLDLAAWQADLAKDRGQLDSLHQAASQVTPRRDAKLSELRKHIENKVKNPTTNARDEKNRKVIVFTAFADTAAYLYDNLNEWARETLHIHAALVTGGSHANKTTLGRADFNEILINFSPRARQREQINDMPQTEEVDLLIATDCISEGQNLQDGDLLVNYDIHWNPVRIIQRFGRIDRIGSLNREIEMINFWPTPDLNKYIQLKNRVEARMALVDIAATAEDNILQVEDLDALDREDMRYRDKQLLRLKDEILDLEDFNESISLSDFTLDDFRMELASYIEANRAELENAPFGLYAVVPPNPQYATIKPGVIYCLKQRQEAKGADTVNPLQPYFLVYIRDDGEVRYNFTKPKPILEIFRALCRGEEKPYEQLCKLFDRQTDNGRNMGRYDTLLKKAVSAIVAQFARKNTGNLFAGRGGRLTDTDKQVKDPNDLELITWLIIMEETTSSSPSEREQGMRDTTDKTTSPSPAERGRG